MISFSTAKNLLLTFGPLILPKILSYYRSLRSARVQRPPPRPIPAAAQRALNILCLTAFIFLACTLASPPPNIFALTSSRPLIPTDVLFTRLSQLRQNGNLTPAEEMLRSKITTPAARSIYFHFGSSALSSCLFCDPDQPMTYIIYTLPRTILPSHLLNFFSLALATSTPLVGLDASIWRNKFTLSALVLFAIDLSVTAALYDPTTPSTIARRLSLTVWQLHFHWYSHIGRYLVLTMSSLISAGLIYLSSTYRLPLPALFFSPTSPAQNIDGHLASAVRALDTANAKLHALGVTRNAVARDRDLRGKEEEYWRSVEGAEEEVWGREDVVEAVKNVLAGDEGEEGLDVGRLGKEAEQWVAGVTTDLEE